MRALLFLSVVSVSSLALAQRPAGDLTGFYTVTGANPGGAGKYGGEVKLARNGGVFLLASDAPLEARLDGK